jgi:hypothetical protein
MSNYISGPVNTIRLEGTINNKKKVAYIFFDYHINVRSQTECKNIRSSQIRKFLVDTIDDIKNKEPDRVIDLFIERDL